MPLYALTELIFATKSTAAASHGCCPHYPGDVARRFSTQRLTQIAAPTLVLAGEHGPALAAVHLTHRMLPGAVPKRIPGDGHLSNLDQPDVFPNQMLHFLRGIEVDSGV